MRDRLKTAHFKLLYITTSLLKFHETFKQQSPVPKLFGLKDVIITPWGSLYFVPVKQKDLCSKTRPVVYTGRLTLILVDDDEAADERGSDR